MYHFKKIGIFLICMFFLCGSYTFALDCEGFGDTIQNSEEVPSIVYIICPLQAAINIGLYFVGTVLVIMVMYGGIKALTAAGDPRQLEGAKLTWTNALFGALVVLLAFVLVGILFGLLGSSINPLNIADGLEGAFDAFWTTLTDY